ncbi:MULTISPECIES: sensor histidine kinase [unclassified Microbispora]|uniref:sensor histidine kinase n=1 Tax=unclassified Microbispora TaxID=2614687 RepID=UPI001C7292C2|nr:MULTISPECIES: sensor histidine kinase [unclassified Microbispora]
MDDPDVRPLFPRPLRRGELVALDTLAGLGYAFALSLQAGVPAAWTTHALIVAMTLPVAVRRRWPLPVFGVVLAASVAAMALGVVREPLAAAAYALYPVALTTPRRRWEPTTAIGALSLGALLFTAVGGVSADPASRRVVTSLVLGVLALGGAWTIGRAVRERRAYAARGAELGAERAAERAVAEERLRIARELHDVVSHTLSLIGVKAGVAAHVADRHPEEAREALRVIEDTSRRALAEMRQALGVLREDFPGRSPVPGLAALPELAERAAAAGVEVDLDVRVAGALPETLELAVHRIAQEALTNVVRHAAPARCRVLVERDAAEVRVEVTDDGPGRRTLPPGPPGHGLIGMRERALLFGGEFTAGPRPEGGFRVSARLPAPSAAEPAGDPAAEVEDL